MSIITVSHIVYDDTGWGQCMLPGHTGQGMYTVDCPECKMSTTVLPTKRNVVIPQNAETKRNGHDHCDVCDKS